MSRITQEISLQEIDEWFKIGKQGGTVHIESVPRSKTGGRQFDPKTGTARVVATENFDAHLPEYRRNSSREPERNYAEVYQQQEAEQLLQPNMQDYGLGHSPSGSLADTLDQLEIDSTVGGSVAVPDDLVPAGATDVYNNYTFDHSYDIKLPITQYQEQLVRTIESNQVTVIQGSTGSGKTTQVPQYILDHYASEHKYCNIIVTQPRRIAATSIARRVCAERGWSVGSVCGYQIGMDVKASEDTRILYCTTGVLREKFINTKNMLQYTHVILDEVHERDQESDFALLIVRKLLRTNSRHVKVILMSATIDSDLFARYFALPVRDRLEPAPVVSVEGRVFRVSEFYANDLSPVLGDVPDLDEDKPEISEEAQNMAVRLIMEFDNLEIKEQGKDDHTSFSPVRGTVLVFLPGYGEISDLYDRLRTFEEKHKLNIIPLHSTITTEEQLRVFEPAVNGERKVILSTNIAESSITVPDIKYVIDFCLTKNLVCDPQTNYTHLQVEWASKANCTQRKGRAGRVSNGRAYFMVTKRFFEECLPEYGIPEMQRCPLETLVLKTKMFDVGEPKAVLGLALSPPNLNDLERTILNLKEVGALVTTEGGQMSPHDGELTFIGRVLADLPVDIRVGKLIVLGHVFGLLEECLIIGAALSIKSLFAKPFNKKFESYRHKLGWAACSFSDCLAILNAYKVWDSKKKLHEFRRTGQSEYKWGTANFIQVKRINEVSQLAQELEQRLDKFNIQKPHKAPKFKKDYKDPEERLLLKLVICGAFYPNYFLCGEIDESDAVRALSNNDPLNTVYVKGLPSNQGMLYKDELEKKFLEKCQRNPQPIVTFEETKAYIQFPWKSNTLYEHKVHMGVYMAIKMRLLRETIFVNVYSRDDAFMMMSTLQKAQEGAALEGRLRTNRVKGSQGKLENNLHSQSPGNIVPQLSPLSSILFICVTEVVECGHFWAQHYDDQSHRQLEAIQKQLNINRGSYLQPVSGLIIPGTYCAAPYQDVTVEYYRGRIEQLGDRAGRGSEVLVFFIDYGNSEWVPSSCIRKLPQAMMEYPSQAFECYLANIRPSNVKCPDGVWSRQATEVFKQWVLNRCLHAQIYSIVHEAVRVELSETFPDGLAVNISEKLIDYGFAEKAEETYLSRQNHEEREMEARSNFQHHHQSVTDKKPKHGWLEVNVGSEKLANMKGRGRQVKLVGPTSPLEMTFYSMTFIGRLRAARIDPDSVNSVAIDDEPQNSLARMMVAAFVGLNSQGTSMIARDTTIMPLIPGLPALMALLFAPVAELRPDQQHRKLIGAICGLGYELDTNYPILPDHDMEIQFDTAIDIDDIAKINAVRMAINIAIGSKDTVAGWGGEAVYRVQESARKRLLDLIRKKRDPIEPCSYGRPYQWNQINEDYILPHGLEGTDADCSMLLNLHNAVALVDDDDDDRSVQEEVRRSDYLKKHVEWLHKISLSQKRDPIICKLCDVNCQSSRMLALHLQTQMHRNKEMNLYKLYNRS